MTQHNRLLHLNPKISGVTRRSFFKQSAGMIAAANLAGTLASTASSSPAWFQEEWNPERDFIQFGKSLRVQPILIYATPQPKPETSWRSWGGVLSDETAHEEAARISQELSELAQKAEFPVEVLPIQKVKTPEEAQKVRNTNFDIAFVCPASGSGSLLQAVIPPEGDVILFVRHRSGPIYYWYEALSVAYLSTEKMPSGSEPPRLGRTHVDDVVVDDYDEVLWRLRALYGIKNFVGSKMIAIGGLWGKYANDAPQIAKDRYHMDLIEISYDELEPMIRDAMNDPAKISQAEKWADIYLNLPKTTLKTEKPFVVNAFLLYGIFKNLMREQDAPSITIKNCMNTIIPISKTTACLTLGLLNDEGLLAFCESDFVVIPSGVLMRHITGKPVFMHNSTFPHQGWVTCAHCSAPRRMDGRRYEPTTILTHEESDYGAAPKVEIPLGQPVTFVDPEYTKGRWVGMRGKVMENPFYPICRSQQDVQIEGNWKKLISEVRDSHWIMVYGDYLKEAGYAARKLEIQWDNLSDT